MKWLLAFILAGCTPTVSPDGEPEVVRVETRTTPAADHGGGHAMGAAAPARVVGPGLYPDPTLTPGAVRPDCTVKEICTPGYTAAVRYVTEATKKEVFRRYGIDWADHSKYEVDHAFPPLELCGDNLTQNLWPQPFDGVPYTAHDKDMTEDFLRRQVCAGKMTLKEAQDDIKRDWIDVYKRCCAKDRPDR